MGKKKWWLFVIQIVFVLYGANGQEFNKDSIHFNNSIKDKNNLQLLPFQPSLQFRKPELSFGDYDYYWIPFKRKATVFNFENVLKYSGNLSGDSTTILLPVYPGLGDYQNFGGILGNINFSNNLALDYGAFVNTQYGYLFSTMQIIFGGNFLLRYAITNRLQFQTWGQYMTPGNSPDLIFRIRNFFPTTNFGTGLQYNSGIKSKIKVGIEYQYDQKDKTWKPESGGKVLFNF